VPAVTSQWKRLVRIELTVTVREIVASPNTRRTAYRPAGRGMPRPGAAAPFGAPSMNTWAPTGVDVSCTGKVVTGGAGSAGSAGSAANTSWAEGAGVGSAAGADATAAGDGDGAGDGAGRVAGGAADGAAARADGAAEGCGSLVDAAPDRPTSAGATSAGATSAGPTSAGPTSAGPTSAGATERVVWGDGSPDGARMLHQRLPPTANITAATAANRPARGPLGDGRPPATGGADATGAGAA